MDDEVNILPCCGGHEEHFDHCYMVELSGIDDRLDLTFYDPHPDLDYLDYSNRNKWYN